jgi:hypothetical protein
LLDAYPALGRRWRGERDHGRAGDYQKTEHRRLVSARFGMKPDPGGSAGGSRPFMIRATASAICASRTFALCAAEIAANIGPPAGKRRKARVQRDTAPTCRRQRTVAVTSAIVTNDAQSLFWRYQVSGRDYQAAHLPRSHHERRGRSARSRTRSTLPTSSINAGSLALLHAAARAKDGGRAAWNGSKKRADNRISSHREK